MEPGKLDRRAVFSRRPDVEGDDDARGDTFEPFLTVWCQYLRVKGSQKVEGGQDIDQEFATLVIRDSVAARGITAADRVEVQGRGFKVASVGLPNRRSGLISLDVQSGPGGY